MGINIQYMIDRMSYEVGDREGGKKISPLLYIDAIRNALREINTWLISNEIYYKIATENIVTSPNVQHYPVQGKTLYIFNNNIPLKKTVFSLNSFVVGTPVCYFETVTTIGLVPIPNGQITLKRHYIPNIEISEDSEVIDLPNFFEKFVLCAGCIHLVTATENNERVALVPKWRVEKEEEKRNLLRLYQTVRQPKNLYSDEGGVECGKCEKNFVIAGIP